MSDEKERDGIWSRLTPSAMRLPWRKVGAGLAVIGGAGILEWAKVFGDGGSLMQLILSIIFLPLGLWILWLVWPR